MSLDRGWKSFSCLICVICVIRGSAFLNAALSFVLCLLISALFFVPFVPFCGHSVLTCNPLKSAAEMSEDAAFIAAILAAPDDRTALLVYADWLDERSDPRAEYLRLVAAEKPNQRRLTQIRRALDPIWVRIVTERTAADSVWIIEGALANCLGEITDVRQNRAGTVVATVRFTLRGQPSHVEVPVLMTRSVSVPVG
ncbi:TIGR02996 domain-containing protein [Gemmata sp. G18]|uniref:TIGR02996 domain-containing protein n=1 Tax=Gemmata palustris TaxID=2822762 RepID=A0ABS5BWY4_9BACT|nr:TIGR02996 domain-containing protein [Gemmata palustris]MBP3958219.1 TIGR02996 domain-containing protein [Gemmata palustris]